MRGRAFLAITIFCYGLTYFILYEEALISVISDLHTERPKCDPILQTALPDAAMNKSSCLWIKFTIVGRSGNRLMELAQVNEVLSHCSGVATSSPEVNRDSGVVFPPVLIAARGEVNSRIESLMESAAMSCREVNYTWGYKNSKKLLQQCSSTPFYHVHSDIKAHGSDLVNSAVLNVYPDRRSWNTSFEDMMVMYFRGGDILQEVADSQYSQAPCSLFIEAFNFVNASRLMLVFDRNATLHPCIDVVRSKIPNSTFVSPPCDSIGCHMTLLGRASYLVVSGVTTFAKASQSLFPFRRRVVFEYFCTHEPSEYESSIKICAAGNTSAFKPWSYTETTKIQMLTTRSKLVLGKYNMTSIRDFLNESRPH
ncbi:hypothetical protein Naga_100456g3 [Nannochloropsis gaditana]|uniref:Uncharacterized protein n=1 Tax=Nannochloropsis gaditana TaxID=72520 RepID=W7TJK2_9STRA|nr:hypothetical protein Naga_100456g3 [Nannochloropsis gaditana]